MRTAVNVGRKVKVKVSVGVGSYAIIGVGHSVRIGGGGVGQYSASINSTNASVNSSISSINGGRKKEQYRGGGTCEARVPLLPAGTKTQYCVSRLLRIPVCCHA